MIKYTATEMLTWYNFRNLPLGSLISCKYAKYSYLLTGCFIIIFFYLFVIYGQTNTFVPM